MSKIKLLSIAVVGLLVINLGLMAFLLLKPPMRPPMGGPPRAGEGPRQVIIDRLGFDQEQRERYEKLIDEHQSAVRRLNEEIKNTKESLYASLADENQPGKDSLIAQLGELQTQIETVHYTHFEAIRKICTPAQLDNYNELTQELAGFFAPGKNPPLRPKD